MTFTLARLISEQAARNPENIALVHGERLLSYRELDARSNRLANLLAGYGVGYGDRVTLLARNHSTFFEAAFACSKLGAVLAGLNWRLSPRELDVIVNDAGAEVELVENEFASKLRPNNAVRISAEDNYEDLLTSASDTPPSDLVESDTPIDGATAVLQLYSSGTTGAPKGVVISNDNLSQTPQSAARLYNMGPSTVNLVVSPLFHIGGIGYGLHALTVGGQTVIATAADGDTLCRLIERWGVTNSFMVPSMIQSLIEAPIFASSDLSSLDCIAFGGAPISEALYRRASSELGCGFTAVYGMTETSGTVIADYPDPSITEETRIQKLGTCGRPLPWTGEVGIFDYETGTRCAPGATGEIWVRSQQVTTGYWHRPEATSQALRPDGWFRTGDAAYQDADGFIYLQDRLKDMIISGGENVFSSEVESVIAELAQVQQVAVIGVPSEKWGETVKAVVCLRPGKTTTEAEIIAYTRENLAHYKCPTSVDFVDELPANSSGKILKPELRRRYRSEDALAEVTK